MFLYWIKNRSLFAVFVNAISILLVCLIFINPNIQTCGENRLATSVYRDSDISFDIKKGEVFKKVPEAELLNALRYELENWGK